MKQIVFYHANCMDGTGAALAHQWAFENIVADFVYQPINYPQASDENKFAEFLQKKEIQLWGVNEVWFLDFTPTLPVLQFLLKLGIKILSLITMQRVKKYSKTLKQWNLVLLCMINFIMS